MNRFLYPALFVIIAIAAFLRLWDLRDIPSGLYHDEAMNANQAREAWREGDFKLFYPENNGREGLFINIQAFSMAAFGYTPFAARLPSAMFGILTVLGVFFLTKELLQSDRIALFASFFFATSFWHINFSRIGFRAIMAPFFLVWSFYFLWKFINMSELNAKRSTPACRWAWLYAGISGLFFGLGFHSYIAYRIAPLLLVAPFFVGWRMYKKSKLQMTNDRLSCIPCLLVLFLFLAFIAALPLGLHFLQHPADFGGRSAQVSIFSSETPLYDLSKNILLTFGMFFWQGDYNWRHNFAGSPQLWWPVALLFLFGLGTSIKKIYDLRFKIHNFLNLKSYILNLATSAEAFLFLWFSIFLLPVVFSNEGLPHALRSLPLVIPAVIFAAIGLEWLIEKIRLWLARKEATFPQSLAQLTRIKKEFILLLFAFFAAVAAHGFNQYFLRWASNSHVADAFNVSYADLGRYLTTLPDATQKYVIVNTPGHMLADNIPMPAQTVMFFSDTWNRQKRADKHVIFIPSTDDLSMLPVNLTSPIVIAMLENDPQLRHALKTRYPELSSTITDGGLILINY